MSWKTSSGVKRYIAAVLGLVTFGAVFVPEAAAHVVILRDITGVAGAIALSHAIYARTAGRYISGTVASSLSVILAVFGNVASTTQLVSTLYWITGITASIAVGARGGRA